MDEAELMRDDVDLAVTHSPINYKDGLAITGERPVVRRFPMIPGVDLAGRVTRSTHPDFKPGDRVVARLVATTSSRALSGIVTVSCCRERLSTQRSRVQLSPIAHTRSDPCTHSWPMGSRSNLRVEH